jgi:hypothetical protein
MLEKDKIYKLLTPVKGWPVKEAETLEEAAGVILGSPYWDIPVDTYKVIDKNETYSLLAVYKEGRISMQNRYLATNMKLTDKIEPVNV